MSWIAGIPLVFSIPRLDVDTIKFYENGEYTAELVVGEYPPPPTTEGVEDPMKKIAFAISAAFFLAIVSG
jgi:hypothetical protein